MRPRERRETGEQDLFRSRLDQIIDLNHPLAKLARTVDRGFLEGRFETQATAVAEGQAVQDPVA
jgi:IS5 family transposase